MAVLLVVGALVLVVLGWRSRRSSKGRLVPVVRTRDLTRSEADPQFRRTPGKAGWHRYDGRP